MSSATSYSLHLRTHGVAPRLLVLGAAGLRAKPLDGVPEFSPLSLIVKTESFGPSRAEVELLIAVPLKLNRSSKNYD